jgi:hypothetical protein
VIVRVCVSIALLLLTGVPAAMPLVHAAPQDLCISAGPVTYRLSPSAPAPDIRVRIDNAAPRPDLRVRLVDHAELADLVLVDDPDRPAANACAAMGEMRTARIVSDSPDITLAVSREPHEHDFALYVHSSHISDQDAAALFALMQRVQTGSTLAQAR